MTSFRNLFLIVYLEVWVLSCRDGKESYRLVYIGMFIGHSFA